MNLHIEDSYLISAPADIKKEVERYFAEGKLSDKRSIRSYVHEWYAHNRLYEYGLFKSRTKDVDLNDDETSFRLWCYEFIWNSSSHNLEAKELEKEEDL